MDFEQKLEIIIKEIREVYLLNENQANLIKKNISNRVKMYKNIIPNNNKEETRIITNSRDIGDFFLNRLITNIREYDFEQSPNQKDTIKGTYTSDRQSLYVGSYQFIEDITRNKLQRRMTSIDNETLRKATMNVLNHEIGHALQSSFKGINGNNDTKYNELITRLISKYPNVFSKQAIEEPLTLIQGGMIPKRKQDSKEQIRNYYARVSFTTHLDEIFNEDEALIVTGVKNPQIKYDMGDGFSKNIYNYQSSNYKITSYGRMMKIIMGEKKTFQSMYEDPIIAYEFFDQFKEISDKSFQGSKYEGKPPMLNILNALDQIRNHSSLEESLKLDLFLTECLQKKVIHELKNPNLDQLSLQEIKNYIDEFSNQMTKSPNKMTTQDTILINIRKLISEQEKRVNENRNNPINNDNIEESKMINQINKLKIKVIQLHSEYKEMMKDGHIDIDELNDLIIRMNTLEQTVINIKTENLNESQDRIMNQISKIIQEGKEKMNQIYSQKKQQEILENQNNHSIEK